LKPSFPIRGGKSFEVSATGSKSPGVSATGGKLFVDEVHSVVLKLFQVSSFEVSFLVSGNPLFEAEVDSIVLKLFHV
jgi:hypothetical protein